MYRERLFPDYIFESSWEVCNKVGGIYAVLSTRAKTLQERIRDHVIFIGPDVWEGVACPYFIEDGDLLSNWRRKAAASGLNVRVGRWNVPGEPIAILVDFKPFFDHKNDIYAKMWEWYGVDSLHAYGDYDEASMFSIAAAKVVEHFCKTSIDHEQKIVYHGNEWMTCLGLLYLRHEQPQIATIFTTHATSIGRSIAGNGKPLYDYFEGYHGDQMAAELNMQSKHSVEKQAAHYVDCFTTVSDITAKECAQLLDKPVDVVLPNGFENTFVPRGTSFTKKRKTARRRMIDIANNLLGASLDDDTLIVSTSGRYEFRNKGIDVFIESLSMLNQDARLKKNVLAFICVPAWVAGPRQDLQERLSSKNAHDKPLCMPMTTHWLHNMDDDNVLSMARRLGMTNTEENKVKLIFVPCYLDGGDGIFNMNYYDVVLGNDLCVFPSYYEPWGYTPLEAAAFHVPCITSNLAGFGIWALGAKMGKNNMAGGVKVIERTDSNFMDAAHEISDSIVEFASMTSNEVAAARKAASALSENALWSKFIKYYEDAYDFALRKALARKEKMNKK